MSTSPQDPADPNSWLWGKKQIFWDLDCQIDDLVGDSYTNETAAASYGGPSFFAHRGLLYLTWADHETKCLHWMHTADGENWSTKRGIDEMSGQRPYAVSFKQKFFISWKGLFDQKINIKNNLADEDLSIFPSPKTPTSIITM
jgi:hypothetical protein